MRITGTLEVTGLPGWFHAEDITLREPHGLARVSTSSEPLDPEVTSTEFAVVQGDLMRSEFPGYHEHTFESAWVFGREDGFIRDCSWAPDGVPIRQLTCYAVHDGRGYTATATVRIDNFEQFESDLRRILASIRIV